ncbi:hypothetical protein [Corynebacterium glutamicum]|uniref:Hypothetical membrane protein n=1 Tax=Corynebacterium glutamicum (strain ATCC 13032 / DSM 20300 / JCM 1318 / BCRC 11384 / CCUG 27702 / LMG 3730 / NBRC 12168 / NCIMB 10025 / NRRL B-2784 / 534) TaxID=196627 RepID=Q8NPD6_CORGL|nr:hypothetical protein [Corynebacterium glutamicum]NII99512.1 membrane protein DedA with SNARE-associated domain [Corynebacterium glutamicum]BAB99270.1 Hypothetical membrane protein [Corynebacterium glutamicum ATCC 13032]
MSTTKTPRSTITAPIDQLSPIMRWVFQATNFLGSLIKPLLIVTALVLVVAALTPERFHETLVLNILAFSAGYAVLRLVRSLRRLLQRH